MARDVIIFDTTLRDGEQAPGNSMTAEEKLRLARQLDTLGVDVIEAGFPSASEGDRRGVRAIAEAVRRPLIAALARCHDPGIDLAGAAVRPAAPPPVHVGAANSLAAIEAGAGQVECTVNGIGERAGNAALEEIVMAGRVRSKAVAFHCGVNPQELFRTSQLLSHVIGVFPQPNKAVVGRNAFAHEAGIHQHGVLQNGLTYEIIRPEEVGVARSSLVLGKHSGRHALERRYRELGYEVDDATLRKLYDEFTTLADKKREILDEDLLALLHGRFHDAPEAYRLAYLPGTCGTVSATAEVRLAGPWNGAERGGTAVGNGPIAAALAAIAKVVERQVDVLNLTVQSVTPGRDSLGQVLVQARIDGKSLSGHGASTDIVEASARALVHALNKVSHADQLEDQSLNASSFWGV